MSGVISPVAAAFADCIIDWWNRIRNASGDCRTVFPAPTDEIAEQVHQVLLDKQIPSYLVGMPGSLSPSPELRIILPDAVTSVRDGSFVCVLQPGVLSRLQDSVIGSGGGIRALAVPDEWPWKDGDGAFCFDPEFLNRWMSWANVPAAARETCKALIVLMKGGLEANSSRTEILFDQVLEFTCDQACSDESNITKFIRDAGLPSPGNDLDLLSGAPAALQIRYSRVSGIADRMRRDSARSVAKTNLQRAWEVARSQGVTLTEVELQEVVDTMLDRLNATDSSSLGVLSLRGVVPTAEAEWRALTIEILQILFEAAEPQRLSMVATWLKPEGENCFVLEGAQHCVSGSPPTPGIRLSLGAPADRDLAVVVKAGQQVLAKATISAGQGSIEVDLGACIKASARIRVSAISLDKSLSAQSHVFLEQCDEDETPFVVVPKFDVTSGVVSGVQRFDLEQSGKDQEIHSLELNKPTPIYVVGKSGITIGASVDGTPIAISPVAVGISRLVADASDPVFRSAQPELLVSTADHALTLLVSAGKSRAGHFLLENWMAAAIQSSNSRMVEAAVAAAEGLLDPMSILGGASGADKLRLELVKNSFESSHAPSSPVVMVQANRTPSAFAEKDGIRFQPNDLESVPSSVRSSPKLSSEDAAALAAYAECRTKVIDLFTARHAAVPPSLLPTYATFGLQFEPNSDLDQAIGAYLIAYGNLQSRLMVGDGGTDYSGRFRIAYQDCVVAIKAGQVCFVGVGPWHPIVVAKRAFTFVALMRMSNRLLAESKSWLDRLACLLHDVPGVRWFPGVGAHSSAPTPFAVEATNDPGWLVCSPASEPPVPSGAIESWLGLDVQRGGYTDSSGVKGYLNDFRRAFPSKRGIVVDCSEGGNVAKIAASARELLGDTSAEITSIGRQLPGGIHVLIPHAEESADDLPVWAEPPVCVYPSGAAGFRSRHKTDLKLAPNAGAIAFQNPSAQDLEDPSPTGRGSSTLLQLPLRQLDQGAGTLHLTRIIHNSVPDQDAGLGGTFAKVRAAMQLVCGGGVVTTVETHQLRTGADVEAIWTVLPGDGADPAVLLEWAVQSSSGDAPVILWDFRFALTRASHSYFVMSEIPQGLLANIKPNPVFKSAEDAGPALLELASLGVALGSEAFKSHSRALGVVGLIGATRFLKLLIAKMSDSTREGESVFGFMLPVDSFQDILGAENDVAAEGLDADSRRADLLVVLVRLTDSEIEFSFCSAESKYSTATFTEQRASKAMGQAKKTLDRIVTLARAAKGESALAERLAFGKLIDFGMRLGSRQGRSVFSRVLSAALSGEYRVGLLGRNGCVLVTTETSKNESSVVARSDGVWIRLSPAAWPGERATDRINSLVQDASSLAGPPWRQRRAVIDTVQSAAGIPATAEEAVTPSQESAPSEQPVAPTNANAHLLLGVGLDGGVVDWKAGVNPNHNFMVTGSSGSGKTQLVKSIVCQARQQGFPVIIVDFKNDFAGDPDFLRLSGCEVQYVSYDGFPYNPLIPSRLRDPRTGNDVYPIAQHLSGVVSAFQKAYGLGDQQAAALKDAIREAFTAHGVQPTGFIEAITDDFPDFRVVGELLKARNEKAYNRLDPIFDLEIFKEEFRAVPFSALLKKGLVLDLSAIQSETIQNTLAQLLVYSSHRFLNSLPHSAAPNQMLVFDEAHRVLRSEDIGKLVRECRAYGLSVLLSSQYPSDFPAETASNLSCKVVHGNGRDQERIRVIQSVLGIPQSSPVDLDLPVFQAAIIARPGPPVFARTFGFPHWAVLSGLGEAGLDQGELEQLKGVHQDRLAQVMSQLIEMGLVREEAGRWKAN